MNWESNSAPKPKNLIKVSKTRITCSINSKTRGINSRNETAKSKWGRKNLRKSMIRRLWRKRQKDTLIVRILLRRLLDTWTMRSTITKQKLAKKSSMPACMTRNQIKLNSSAMRNSTPSIRRRDRIRERERVDSVE